MMQSEKIVCTYKITEIDCLCPQNLITHSIKYLSIPYLKFHITLHPRMVNVTVRAVSKLIFDVSIIG